MIDDMDLGYTIIQQHSELSWVKSVREKVAERKGGGNIALVKIGCWGTYGMSVAICG